MGALDRMRKIVEQGAINDGDDDTIKILSYRGRDDKWSVPVIKGYRAEYHRIDNENNPQAIGQEKMVVMEIATRASSLTDLPGFQFERFNFMDATEVLSTTGGVSVSGQFTPWIVCDIAVPALFVRVANDDSATGDNRTAQAQFVVEYEYMDVSELELGTLLLAHGYTGDDLVLLRQMPTQTDELLVSE